MRLLPLCLLLTLTGAASDAAAANNPHVKVRLLSEQDAVASGEPFYAGVHFSLDKNWHIYWQNPGDSGQAPQVRWTLPEGFTSESISWPVPKRIPIGPLMNYGYDDEVLLPIPLRASNPKPADKSTSFTLTAHVKWLACAEICIPGNATLTTSVRRAAANHPNAEAAPLFAAARANLPITMPPAWKASGTVSPDVFTLTFQTPRPPSHAVFLPLNPLQVENAAPQRFAATAMGFSLEMQRSEQLLKNVPSVRGLVIAETSGAPQGVIVEVPLTVVARAPLGLALLLALVGGVILNLMPCVFPVLSIKIIGFLRLSGQDQARMRRHAWLYAAGVVTAFWLLTAVLLSLRYAGQQIGWGFQLQSPRFIVVLASILFLFALNLLGVFEMGTSLMGTGQSLANRGGAVGAFFTGVLATVVATPCTAPFMGSAVGFALSQPPAVCMLVFTALAVGLALPYVALCYAPGAARLLPRPGAWMVTLRQSMAFLLFATVIWLVWVLALQTQPQAVALVLGDFLLLGVAAWLLGRWPQRRPHALAAFFIGCLAVALGLWQAAPGAAPTTPSAADGDLPWEVFSPERVARLRASGRPIFIDFTAAWCVSCKVNEALVFGSAQVRQKIKDLDIALVKGDWTSQDPVITQTLTAFGRSGVPLYVLYGKGKDAPAITLPEVITAGLVLDALNNL